MDKKKLYQLVKESRKIFANADMAQKARLLQVLEAAKEKLSSIDDEPIRDPELQNIISYARKHYPSSPSKMQAFMKYAQRGLRHSEENDQMQNAEIASLADKINMLDKKLAQLDQKLALSESDFVDEK